MILKPYNPITPGTRFRININYKKLLKLKLEKNLITKNTKKGGRNNTGRITVRHIGGGSKKRYRLILFKRISFIGIITNFEYDPNRTSFLAKIFLKNLNIYKYILATEKMSLGDIIIYDSNLNEPQLGDSTLLKNISSGSLIHNIEIKPNKGGQLARSAGCFAYLLEKVDNKFARIKLKSKEQRLISLNCFASIGIISNSDHFLTKIGKAGKNRWLGIRPTVRGVAMNPIDHPHGGGQGKTSGGRPSVTPKGILTKGIPTRKNSYPKFILLSSRRVKLLKKKSTRTGKFSH